MPTLIFSPRANDTAQVLAVAAHRRAVRTESLTSWAVPDHLRGLGDVHLYAGPLFGDAVAADLDLALLEPADRWLATLPHEAAGRSIEVMDLATARKRQGPMFAKPPIDKLFPAAVYPDGSALPGPDRVDDEALVIVSEVVAFGIEARMFVLDGAVLTSSQYADSGELAIRDLDGHEHASRLNGFARDVLAAHAGTLPSATVLDIGMIVHPVTGVSTPVVIEANAAWASGHYACDPDRVLDVVLRAAFSRGGLTGRDTPFVRAVRGVER